MAANQPPSLCLRCHSNVLGKSPPKGTQLSGHGDHDLLGMFALGHEGAIPFAAPPRGLPAAGLDRGGALCQTPLQGPTDFGRIPGGPGPFAQGTPGMGMARLGHTALLTPCPTGILRRRQPEIMHALAGGLAAREVAEFGPHRHGHRALDTAQGLEGVDHRHSPPGFYLRVACECKTPQTCRLVRNGLDVFLQDDRLRRRGTHHLAEPAQVGGTPVGPSCIADSVPEHERFETQLRCLQLPERLVPRPPQVAERCIVDGRDINGSEVPGAHEPSQWHGVPTVGFAPSARLFGKQGRGDDPAGAACLRQVPLEPVAAGTGFVDEDQLRALGLEPPDKLVDITLPGPDRAEGDNLGTMCLGNLGDGDGLCMDLHSDGERARL